MIIALPLIADDAKIDIKLVEDDGTIKKISVKFESERVTNFQGKAEIIAYNGIDYVDKKCQVQEKFDLKLPSNEQEIDPDCCLQLYVFQRPTGICPATKIRCLASKKMMIKKLRERCSTIKKAIDIRYGIS